MGVTFIFKFKKGKNDTDSWIFMPTVDKDKRLRSGLGLTIGAPVFPCVKL
jgi:hypothetical protein